MLNEYGQPREQMWLVCPMVGKGYVPVYVSADQLDAQETADAMNRVLRTDMFEVESLYGPNGVQFEMARDADAMEWTFPGDPRN